MSQQQDSIEVTNWQKIKGVITDKDKIKKTVITLVIYGLIYLAIVVFARSVGFTQEAVQAYFDGRPVWIVIVLFILLQLLASLTPLPDLPFLAAGVLYFNAWQAFGLIMLGMWIGTIVNFYVARFLGKDYVNKHYPQTSKWIDKFAGDYGLESSIVARMFTLVSFDVVGYAAGVSNISIVKFGLASIIGLIPVALNATLFGIAATSTLTENNPTQGFIRSILIFIFTGLLSLLFALAARRYNAWIESRKSPE